MRRLLRRIRYRLPAARRLVAQSPLFDAAWYRAHNSDVVAAGFDAVDHYLKRGAEERRAPGPRFDAESYWADHPDVAAASIPPFLHYLAIGRAEGRRIRSVHEAHLRRLIEASPLFDPEWYRGHYPDIRGADVDPAEHYLDFGVDENRAPGPNFDPAGYLQDYPDVAASGVPALFHYLQSGQAEGRRTRSVRDVEQRRLLLRSTLFDGEWYRAHTPGLAADADPVEHYLATGAGEGRRPSAQFDPGWYLSKYPEHRDAPGGPLIAYLGAGGVDPQPPRKQIPANVRVDFTPAGMLSSAERWLEQDVPDVSIVILSYGRPDMVDNLVRSILLFTDGYRYEIVVIDNGSARGTHLLDPAVRRAVHLVTLGTNHYIGDAYNIGVEQAKGVFVVLMNNDVVVTPGWLAGLIRPMEDDLSVGIVGPKFLYPTGELQEAGAMMAPDGAALQRGKRGNPDAAEFNVATEVDYCTGATMAIRRELYLDLLGYDWRWSPGYYEDVDLCFKVRDRGLRVLYVPDAVVFHIESVTMSVTPPSGNIQNAIAENRKTFVAKWRHAMEKSPRRITAPDGQTMHRFRTVVQGFNLKRRRLGIFFPYEFVPGGGEKYCLSIAEQFAAEADIFLIFQERESILRVLSVTADLGFPDLDFRVITLAEAESMPLFDIHLLLGNELLPLRPSLGRRNFYICQFPFPQTDAQLDYAESLQHYKRIDRYLVYSGFVERHVSQGLSDRAIRIPVSVLEPTVGFIGPRTDALRNRIISVGRFFQGAHNKRHDIMIEAMKGVAQAIPEAALILAGAVHKDESHRAHLTALTEQAAGLPISFHVDVDRAALERLYQDADVYWHATGWDVDTAVTPEKVEHFGISIIEAMSAGCIPIVYAVGGPLEIVKHGINGVTVRSIAELVDWTTRILQNWDAPMIRGLRAQAIETARSLGTESFRTRLLAAVEFPAPRPLEPAESEGTSVVSRAVAIRAHLQRDESPIKQSKFWQDLGQENLRQLHAHGVLNFKRTVNQNYFNWPVAGFDDPQMRELIRAWAADPSLLPFQAALRGSAELNAAVETKHIQSSTTARAYTVFTGLLWWYASRADPALMARLSEPKLGNPIDIRLEGRRISQDLANSAREWQRLAPFMSGARPILAEIGGGYGRLATVALQAQPCRYWVFDVSPALALSEWYLAAVFPAKKVFKWRPFADWSDIAEEVSAAEIAFFSIDQLDLIPERSVTVFAAISVLQEMLPADYGSALRLMTAKTSSAIYLKNWTRWDNSWDGFVFHCSSLVAPEGWSTAFDRDDDVFPAFNEKLFVRTAID